MKVIAFLLLIASTIFLGSEYYNNGKTIEKQQMQIKQLQAALSKQKEQQKLPPAPNFRLSGGKSKTPANTKRPERRFK